MIFTLAAKCRCFSSEKAQSSRNTNQGFLPRALPLPDMTALQFYPWTKGFFLQGSSSKLAQCPPYSTEAARGGWEGGRGDRAGWLCAGQMPLDRGRDTERASSLLVPADRLGVQVCEAPGA